MEAPPPLLVQVLGGNVVTSMMVLGCLSTADATVLQRLHPALTAAVAAVPWADSATPVHNTRWWRAALPAATALKLAEKAPLRRGKALAALSGVTVLNLTGRGRVTDEVIARLPPTLRVLNVSECEHVTEHANFTHLVALESLDCSYTKAVAAGVARLPPSLRELCMCACSLPDTADFSHLRHLRGVVCTRSDELSSATAASLPLSLEVLDVGIDSTVAFVYSHHMLPSGWSVAHLTRLRVLKAQHTMVDDDVIAALPPSIQELDLGRCEQLTEAASFAHVNCLHTLVLRGTPISNDTLATLPPSLVSLDLFGTSLLTPDAVFPCLPALRVLNVSHSGLGDAAVGSMPPGLEEVSIICCSNVTQHASLAHLVALRVLQSVGTDLSPTAIAGCRARGCFVPSDGKLAIERSLKVTSLAPLPDGRLVSASECGCATLWASAHRHSTVVAQADLLYPRTYVRGLAVLPDGHRVAVGALQTREIGTHGIVVWDTRSGASTIIAFDINNSARALEVDHNGRLVASCFDGKLRMVDVDAGAVVATLELQTSTKTEPVKAMAVLQGGRGATASESGQLMLWDLGTGTGHYAASLAGSSKSYRPLTSLAVLADGRFASGMEDHTVRLWDADTRACIRVLTGHNDAVRSLAVLPGNRLASLSADSTIRVWDTRDDARGSGGALARPPLVIEFGIRTELRVLVAIPGNRLAAGGDGGVYLWQLPPPDVDVDT